MKSGTRTFRKTTEVKLNLGEILDLRLTHKELVRQAIKDSDRLGVKLPKKHLQTMDRLARKLIKAEQTLRKSYKK